MRFPYVFIALASALSIAAADRATAADIPAPALKAAPFSPVSYAWSGFYVGLHGGYGWSDGRTDVGINDPSGLSQTIGAAGGFPLGYSFDRNGYVFGGQLGFNWQSGMFVWGGETDFSATAIDGSQTVTLAACPICGGPNRSTVTQNMDWFGTLRARLGIAASNWLFYGTGGLAYGHVKYSYLQTNAPFGGPLTIAGAEEVVKVGWAAGAGIEYGWDRWSGRVEYLYYDLGNHSFSAPNPLAPPALGVALIPNFQNTGSIIRGAVNYRFN
jgi:outer membrane immunogenic protein